MLAYHESFEQGHDGEVPTDSESGSPHRGVIYKNIRRLERNQVLIEFVLMTTA